MGNYTHVQEKWHGSLQEHTAIKQNHLGLVSQTGFRLNQD